MNTKYLAVVAALAVTLVAGSVFVTTGSAFAYKKSQAVSQVNDCGNGELAENVWCQNTASQIQGDGNEAALASGQGATGGGGDGPD
jgi:hypothetical protein